MAAAIDGSDGGGVVDGVALGSVRAGNISAMLAVHRNLISHAVWWIDVHPEQPC